MCDDCDGPECESCGGTPATAELLGPVEHTPRGFEIIHFTDLNGQICSLQQSSLAGHEPPGTSAVWLGVQNEMRMHIDLEQTRKLVDTLQRWIDDGSFVVPEQEKVSFHGIPGGA